MQIRSVPEMESSSVVAISSPPPIPPRKSSPMTTPKHRINKILKPESNIIDSAILDTQSMIIQPNAANNSIQSMLLEENDQQNGIASQSSCYQPKNGYPFFTDDSVDTWPSWPSNC